MKWLVLAFLAALTAIPATLFAQEPIRLEIGNIPKIDDNASTLWGIGGYEIFTVKKSAGESTPIMRTETCDARTVEIFARLFPFMHADGRDVRAINRDGRSYVVVRRWLLIEVMPQDARTEGVSQEELARRWARDAGRVLPKVCPINQFGI